MLKTILKATALNLVILSQFNMAQARTSPTPQICGYKITQHDGQMSYSLIDDEHRTALTVPVYHDHEGSIQSRISNAITEGFKQQGLCDRLKNVKNDCEINSLSKLSFLPSTQALISHGIQFTLTTPIGIFYFDSLYTSLSRAQKSLADLQSAGVCTK